MIKKNKTKGFILVIIAALFWGYMGVPTKNLADCNFDPFSVSVIRTSIAGIFYFLYCFKKDPFLLKINKKGMLFFAFYGVVTFGATFICYNVSVTYISIALGTMFMFTSQVWVIILSYFLLKEQFTFKKILAVILTLIGCFMMCKLYNPSNVHLNLKGVILGLISGFTFALQIILAKISSNKYHYNENTLLAYSFLFASLCLIPFINFKNIVNLTFYSNNTYFILKNIFIIGFLNTIIANGAYVKSVQYIEVGIASIIGSSEIVIASVVGYLVFNETLNFIQVMGMILIVLSVIILEIDKKKINNLMEKIRKNESNLKLI